ncbi:dynein intermediate chain CFAP94, axonemal-like [Pollicipes pollicipes]|uniref:dynein intermediate chain CFAP94, axonemal-like n=1 Tax=Pollicipes pollicipes TaxID=41117 RepID=UPI001885874D|nr:dynein intermediate chain CFAP94, axonemal-like [Pollicipes pollicipes]
MRVETERLEAEEQRLREAEERVLRRMQLIDTDETVRRTQEGLAEAQALEYQNDRWERYMRCDGLPDPLTRQEVTAYLNSWRESPIEVETHLEVMRRTDQVLRVIDDLQRHVRDKAYGDGELSEDMATILQQYQDTQTAKLDVATYNVLTDLRPHIDLETNTVQFCSLGTHISLALWSNCSKNLKNKGYLFQDLGVRFELPKQLMDKDIAVRIMRTEYDHVSKFCRTKKMLDLAEFRAREALSDVILEEDVRLQREQEEAERAAIEKAEREAAEAAAEAAAAAAAAAKEKRRPGFMSAGSSRSASPAKSSVASSPAKSPGGKKKKGKKGKKGKKSKSRSPKRKTATPAPEPEPEPPVVKVASLLMVTDKEEVNLRRYRVIGGLIHFDLLDIPPQPKVVGDWTLRAIDEPQTVRRYAFRADYQPPPPPESQANRRREPEQIEREIRQQEAELQKLIAVSVDLPDTTLWFEPPFFVRWDDERTFWSTEGFYDSRYNEETYVLQSRTLRLGLFGLAVNRFSNLPYQSWAFTPTGVASAELSITAAVATVHLLVQDDLVSLIQVTGGSSDCLEAFYKQPMKPEKLKQVMQRHGLDLFPEEDSYLYIEGSSLKHQPCEKHLYWCMALVGNAYGFSSSRWNLLAGADNLVLQFREMLSEQLQGNPALLLVRPRKTTIVECLETSQAWADAEAPGMPYFADLYHLVEGLGSQEARARLEAAPCTFVDCLHTLFTSTRLLSYS